MAKNKKVDTDIDQTFDKKWMQKLPTGYAEGAEAKTTDELEKEIVKARGTISDVELDQKNDTKLQILKEDIKALVGAYHDTQVCEDAKVRYCLHLLRQRGAR